jgi:photosystem II stability/assembly factor-like uncharacterized protein
MKIKALLILGLAALTLSACYGDPPVKITSKKIDTPQQTIKSKPAEPSPAIKETLELKQVSMMSPTSGWGMDSAGNIVQTINGGREWSNRNPDSLDAPSESRSFFPYYLDEKMAWVFDANSLTVYRTTDGAKSWQKGEPITPNIVFDGGLALFFKDKDHGWLELMSGGHSQAGELFTTEDGGLHWKSVTGFNKEHKAQAKANELPFGASIAFRDLTHGWTGRWSEDWGPASAQSNVWLYKTEDGGKSWAHQDLPIPEIASYRGISLLPPTFFDEKNGILPVALLEQENKSTNVILTTKDGGMSWQSLQNLPFQKESELTTIFLTKSFGWAWSRASSKIFLTSNGGDLWEESTPNLDLSSVQQINFVGEKTGFLIKTTENRHELYTTMDAGKTWSLISPVLEHSSKVIVSQHHSHSPIRLVFTKKNEVDTFIKAFSTAEKMKGILKAAPPDFDVLLSIDGKETKPYLLWLHPSSKQGMIMEAERSETGYILTKQATDELKVLMKQAGLL